MRLPLVGIFFVLLILGSMNAAHAQNLTGISASTNEPSYEAGDKVIITGSISQPTDENPVTIIVRNPIGNVYEVGQVPIMNNLFVHDFVLSDDAQGGIYKVNIRQGNQISAIQFQVISGQVQIIPVFDSEIRVSGENTSLIKYGNVEVSTVDNSIVIQMNTTKIRNGSILEEYHIPKRVVDAVGGQLAVKEDGNNADCTQTETDIARTLKCPIQAGTKELAITGTTVIPEFVAAPYILVFSIIVAVIFMRTRLFQI